MEGLGGMLYFLLIVTGWENATVAYTQRNNRIVTLFKVEGACRTEIYNKMSN
jgi:hypothetical protein